MDSSSLGMVIVVVVIVVVVVVVVVLLLLLLLLLLYGCWLIIWGQDRSPGWSILRGDSGENFVNPKERLEVNDVCLVLIVDSV